MALAGFISFAFKGSQALLQAWHARRSQAQPVALLFAALQVTL